MVLTDDDQPMTTHTTNPVPVIVTKEGLTLRETGRLGDLAPTLLDLLNVILNFIFIIAIKAINTSNLIVYKFSKMSSSSIYFLK